MIGASLTFPSMPQDITKTAYEAMLSKPLSDDAFTEAQDNLMGFFAVLVDMERDLYLRQKANEEL